MRTILESDKIKASKIK